MTNKSSYPSNKSSFISPSGDTPAQFEGIQASDPTSFPSPLSLFDFYHLLVGFRQSKRYRITCAVSHHNTLSWRRKNSERAWETKRAGTRFSNFVTLAPAPLIHMPPFRPRIPSSLPRTCLPKLGRFSTVNILQAVRRATSTHHHARLGPVAAGGCSVREVSLRSFELR